MANPEKHHCKLDVAEEILDFIANDPRANAIREMLRAALEMNDSDFENAHDIVENFRDLIDDQQY